ncbi:MAG: 2-amino-4-hydroxy-6-hydroxymethyldihydropteridine diphosphokinase [Prevotella sp.]|nr:2-amino-4-hydroxy-6-hydroxymethyldihydropteridine diphosphokinase [Prevotella sp.]MBR5060783.1 2-amino-4-hydroxy-6-hydroxymethyldihydropteridine diphosphokinase [Prevotella sp.]
MDGHCVYLALGSNLGNRQENILRAINAIQELIGSVECQSTLVDTEPWGFESENRFLNAVIRVNTSLSPRQLLKATKKIEKALGRKRKSHTKDGRAVYHDRIIDIDILLYGNVIVDEPDLKIPHPLMLERDFVMIPLRQVLLDTTVLPEKTQDDDVE